MKTETKKHIRRALRRNASRHWLKVVLLPVITLLYILYYPYLYIIYCRRLREVSSQKQLFFLARDEYGAILHMLYYIQCWANARNAPVLVVLSPRCAIIKMLVRHICPAVQTIMPCHFLSKLLYSVFPYCLRRFVYIPLFCSLRRRYPEAIYIYEMNKDNKCDYVKYLDSIYMQRSRDSLFWDAYTRTRGVFDCKYDVYQDFLGLARDSEGITVDDFHIRCLMTRLEITGKYAIINLNVKYYLHENGDVRRIVHYDRYNVLIDVLIGKGYSVVLQGTDEQPYFEPRKGFSDYAHSSFQSAENDLYLFCGCEFFISSKTGAELYGLLCDKPVLGLNYTELCAMQPNIRFRFFPKRIRDEEGRYLPWRTVLTHPVYFQLGHVLPTRERYEFVEMEERDLILALDEFLELLAMPSDQWLNYSLLQNEFRQMLHPGHLDLYHISGVPCDAYLNEESVQNRREFE